MKEKYVMLIKNICNICVFFFFFRGTEDGMLYSSKTAISNFLIIFLVFKMFINSLTYSTLYVERNS